MASITNSTSDKADPTLMGVTLPLSLTVTAAKQVGAAWKDAGMSLVQAISQAKEGVKAKAAKKVDEKKDELNGTAAAAAGVSA